MVQNRTHSIVECYKSYIKLNVKISNEITQMTYMRDAEVFYKQRDAEIKTIVNRLEIVTKSFGGHTLYEPEDIIEANDGEIPLSHSEFYQVVKKMGDPTPQIGDLKPSDFKDCLCPINPNHDEVYGLPTLSDFGFEEQTHLSSWHGGEFHALNRLKEKMANENLMSLPKRLLASILLRFKHFLVARTLHFLLSPQQPVFRLT